MTQMPLEKAKKPKVLICRLSHGDVVLGLGVLSVLKERGYETGWVVQEEYRQLLENHPFLDHLYLVPWQRWKKASFVTKIREFSALIRQIRAEKYDYAVDLQGLLKSSIFALFSGASVRITNHASREIAPLVANRIVKLPPDPWQCMPRYYVRFLEPLRINLELSEKLIPALPPVPAAAIKQVDRWLANWPLSAKRKIVIAPFSAHACKDWPDESWTVLLKNLPADWPVIWVGGAENCLRVQKMVRPHDLNLMGKTDFLTLIELLSRADLLLSLDTGCTHLAWACQKPKVLALYSATKPIHYLNCSPFPPDHYQILIGSLACQPCHRLRCELKPPAFENCRSQIQPSVVWSKLLQIFPGELAAPQPTLGHELNSLGAKNASG